MKQGETPITIAELLRIQTHIFLRPLGVQSLHGAIVANNVCEIDPRSRNVARTFMHELAHAARPLWSETRIRRWESKLWRGASWQEKALLLKKLAEARIWAGEEGP